MPVHEGVPPISVMVPTEADEEEEEADEEGDMPDEEFIANLLDMPPTPLSMYPRDAPGTRRRASLIDQQFGLDLEPGRAVLPKRRSKVRDTKPYLRPAILRSIVDSTTELPMSQTAYNLFVQRCGMLFDAFAEVVSDGNKEGAINNHKVEHVLKELNLLGKEQSLSDLMRNELPEDILEQVIPIAQAGNRVVP